MPARLFGFLWIIVGIVIMSIFTATLATAFSSEHLDPNNIVGLSVSMHFHLYFFGLLIRWVYRAVQSIREEHISFCDYTRANYPGAQGKGLLRPGVVVQMPISRLYAC